jgi:RNA polymerase sigma-70 factor, ECF subfamily
MTIHPLMEANQTELLDRARKGEVEAFYHLVKPCERSVFMAAMALLNNEADAEEVAQEAVLKAFKNVASFRGESKFSTWLVQITVNEARMKLRKDRRHLYESLDEPRTNEEGDFTPRELEDWREIPSKALETRELREAIAKALAGLKEKYRSVFVLRDVQKLSIRETANMLGLSEADVKTCLMRARLQMREALAPGFGGAWSRKTSQPKSRATGKAQELPAAY